MLLILFVVVIVLALGGGGWGYSRWGAYGFSPALLLLLVAIVLFATGHLRMR